MPPTGIFSYISSPTPLPLAALIFEEFFARSQRSSSTFRTLLLLLLATGFSPWRRVKCWNRDGDGIATATIMFLEDTFTRHLLN
ncbi:hypothetical protein VNO77_04274 [Canavalia gladiata]|uniref:Uncharacterized protein n=1 Tax=Canavalia gladiata TaxID=3824 RepID=A0AAN9MW85_CANGL